MEKNIKVNDGTVKTAALRIKNLNKTLGRRQILFDINFEAYRGEVFGFLGPNGAGKTTTIKLITGLLTIDEGSIEIGGYNLKKHYEKALGSIGGIVENPEMYKHMTGMDNLKQYARMRDGVTQERIEEVVKIVGLSNRINEKIKRYSLGMRQRLGVAQALLHRPSLLLLDEPTNGLDPAGIKELRDILKKLAHEENICVLVSSHLMSEMELMCDRVGIINNGKMVGVYTVEEMMRESAGDTSEYIYNVDNAERAAALFSEMEYAVTDDTHIDVVFSGDDVQDRLAQLNCKLIESGVKLYTVSPKEKKKLEDVFIEITQTGGVQIG
ncbi:MAG: ABC transporter ATP-binding protein [Ruminococcus sp.]|nr:ABC transporter ATP-binding protein [Ruminococcus sp.]